DGQRRDVRERAPEIRGRALSARLRHGRRGRDLRAPPRGRLRRSPDRAHSDRSRSHLQSRLLHLGRAARCAARGFRPPAAAGILDGAAGGDPPLGRSHPGVQRRGRTQSSGITVEEGKLAEAYLGLRRRTQERDRSLREKVMSLEEAAKLVKDGDKVGIGGRPLSRTPMAMIWALIRAGRKRLSCSRSIMSSEGELLFGSGASDHVLTSWFSQGIVWGVSKVMRLYTESKRARFEEWSHMAVGMRFRAGAMGVPVLPMRSMMGPDVISRTPH